MPQKKAFATRKKETLPSDKRSGVCPKCGTKLISGQDACPKCHYSSKTAYKSRKEAKEFTHPG